MIESSYTVTVSSGRVTRGPGPYALSINLLRSPLLEEYVQTGVSKPSC
jgi:hypothetical protein